MNRLLPLLLCWACVSIDTLQAQRLTDHLDQKWSTYIGLTTFRTNFKLYNNWIIIGSNGDHVNDPMYMDENAGVKIVDLKSGEIVKTLEEGEFWDTDVNGIEVVGDKLYFGNDNEEFFCYNLKSLTEEWSIRTSGDIECAPALSDINGDGIKELIIATEAGEISALNAKDGKYLWTYRVPGFEGYASSNTNIVAFKIFTTFRTAGTHFYTTPLMDDVNNDGIKDAIISSGDHYTYCVNGKTGALIWRVEGGEYTHEIIKYNGHYLVQTNENIFNNEETEQYSSWDFDYVRILDKTGRKNQTANIRIPNYYSGGDFLVEDDKIITPISDGIAQVDIKTGKTRIIYFPDVEEYEQFSNGNINFTKPKTYSKAPAAWDKAHIPYITVNTTWKRWTRPTTVCEAEVLPEWEGEEYCFHYSDRLVVVRHDFSSIRIMSIGKNELGTTKTTEAEPMFFNRGGQSYYLSATSDGKLHLFEMK